MNTQCVLPLLLGFQIITPYKHLGQGPMVPAMLA